jgi:hypothetical protein
MYRKEQGRSCARGDSQDEPPTQGQLERLSALSKKEGVGEAELLREALDDLLKKYADSG